MEKEYGKIWNNSRLTCKYMHEKDQMEDLLRCVVSAAAEVCIGKKPDENPEI